MMFVLVISLLLQAAPDSLPAVQKSADRTLPVRVVEEGSAALFLYGPDATFTQAGVSWNGRSESAPLYKEEGKGLQEGQVNIRTLVRLDSTQAVRGSVRYTNGVKQAVNWNSSSDFFTVYPYVVADTVGGNVNKEEYAFSGGYAARYGAFHWGAEAAYRALHEYRMVDPRPRNIVSDLQVKASAGWRVLPTYVVEATVGYRRYSQTQSMAFISERGKNSSVFHFTGLGSDFARFTGATDSYMNTRYAGNGLLLGMAWSPLGAAGWEASVSYRHLDITHYLPNLNQVPYTELYTRTLQAQGGYLSRFAVWSWKAGAHLQYQWRQGLESILDSGASGYLKELGRLLMFSSEALTASVHGAVDYRQQWSLQGRAEYRSFSALYAYPARSLSYGGLDGGCLPLAPGLLVCVTVSASRYVSATYRLDAHSGGLYGAVVHGLLSDLFRPGQSDLLARGPVRSRGAAAYPALIPVCTGVFPGAVPAGVWSRFPAYINSWN